MTTNLKKYIGYKYLDDYNIATAIVELDMDKIEEMRKTTRKLQEKYGMVLIEFDAPDPQEISHEDYMRYVEKIGEPDHSEESYEYEGPELEELDEWRLECGRIRFYKGDSHFVYTAKPRNWWDVTFSMNIHLKT